MPVWYADMDGDGYGDPEKSLLDCEQPAGYVGNDQDCDDSRGDVNPDASELCDGVDNDCDGTVDEDTEQVAWYTDKDGDGYGDALGTAVMSCSAITGHVSNNQDCDDNNAAIHPGASEICDGLDNDCDGVIDEDIQMPVWYADADGDGFGDPNDLLRACEQPEGYVANGDDNCPGTYNPDQADNNGNGIGDACEGDCVTLPVILSLHTPIDPNPVNTTIQVSAQVNVDVAEAIWIWGDGTETVVANPAAGLDASHVYVSAGVYVIELIVKDACGNDASLMSNYLAIYDPDGGFVTGGGWIWSPPGAYIADNTLEGKANFGFVAKYKNGSNVPVGHTEFHFQAGNLRFNSSSYDAMRLIISGARAQFKGVGTINGKGNYGFMVSVVDGQVNGGGGLDKFRIKIWDMDNQDAMVYDNNVQWTDENAEPATVISGGSIIIHKTKNNKEAYVIQAEASGDMEFRMWPNPTTGLVQITLPPTDALQVRVDVHSAAGTRVISEKHLSGQPITLDLSGYVTGMYMVRVTSGEQVFTRKLILTDKHTR